MKSRPLADRRILVTRAEDQGGGLVEALERLGARVLWIPAIRTSRTVPGAMGKAVLSDLEAFGWAAFASPNAVRYFFEALAAEGGRLPPSVSVAAVGAATEAALEERGTPVAARPSTATGKALGECLRDRFPPSRVLVPRGRTGRDELAEILAGAGWNVVPLVCYETLAPDIPPELRARLREGLDAALFASPSSARNLWGALAEGERDVLRRALLLPIGPTTESALRALGLAPSPPPASHSVDGLLEALLSHLGHP